MQLNEYEIIAIIAVALMSLFIGSVSDVKKRTVKSYLFIPLIATGSVIDYLVSAPSVFIILTVIVFIATFLKTDISLYLLAGVIFILVSVALIFIIGFFYGFTLALVSLMFLAGYTEKLFGIGDIKGIIAILGSIAPISISVGTYYSYLNSIFPLSFLLIMNLGFMSALSFPVVGVMNKRTFGKMYFIYSPFREDLSQIKYATKIFGNKKYSMYRVPFMLPILAGVALTFLSYFSGVIF